MRASLSQPFGGAESCKLSINSDQPLAAALDRRQLVCRGEGQRNACPNVLITRPVRHIKVAHFLIAEEHDAEPWPE